MSDPAPPAAGWHGRRVFLTGHTGFKGSWLLLWLRELGARVHGYALDPPTEPALFELLGAGALLDADTRADLADLECLRAALAAAQPEVVFHFAAQALVRAGYRDPLGTIASNTQGTAHLLEAVRAVPSVRAVVVVTTDKVYAHRGDGVPFAEEHPLGGHDPYSASKAAAEILAASYRASFFGRPGLHAARIATARAGNVIGGGDWATDRLLPDCLRAFERGEPVRLRLPQAVRPWQHVLEPLAGYLRLAGRLLDDGGEGFATAWNFGPDARADASVGDVAARLAALWGDGARIEHAGNAGGPPEADWLRLDSRRAHDLLGWRPRWGVEEALARTLAWHRAWRDGAEMRAFSRGQLLDYLATEDAA